MPFFADRLSLAYTLEEEAGSFATAGKFSKSSSAYFEASSLFWTCSKVLPGEPEFFLRQWVTGRLALEVPISQTYLKTLKMASMASSVPLV